MTDLPDIASRRSVPRAAAVGAGLLAAVTSPMTCFLFYRGITAGSAADFVDAVALLAGAPFVGGTVGAAYQTVARSRIRPRWKLLVALLVVVEAYLLACALVFFVIGVVAPGYYGGTLMEQVGFWLLTDVYGVLLCAVVFGFMHAPRMMQIVSYGFVLAAILLFTCMILVLMCITPEQLDPWFMWLQPLAVVLWLGLITMVLAAIDGWGRFFRKPLKAEPAASGDEGGEKPG